jgi:hypothetical protein
MQRNEYLTVKFNQSILFARKSVVSFILVHIIDNSDEEMSNTAAKVMNKMSNIICRRLRLG